MCCRGKERDWRNLCEIECLPNQSAAPGLGVQVLPIRTTRKEEEEEEEREVRTCELKNSDNLCVSIPMSPCTFP
jgi:lactate dehydrogenase-like 2-hydroxyacid dehydrogenase